MSLKHIIQTVLIAFLIASCNLKKIHYFQGEPKQDQPSQTFATTFKTGDILSIIVSADHPEVAKPFNINEQIVYSPNRSNNGYLTGAPALGGYLIDSTGTVHLPILGEVLLAGKSRSEAIQDIQLRLNAYLQNPIVHIRILNFKVTVLGDVKQPGTFTIPNERISLLEAIGLAGDLNITGNRKHVKVIRNSNGVERQIMVDLTAQDLFDSEVYYLQQNDVVYVAPNAAAGTQSTVWAKAGAFFISMSSLIVSTIAVVTK